jgi:hypothetical protein
MTGLHFSGFATRAAASDWGVLRLPNGPRTWVVAGTGLPNVEVAGLTIVPSARKRRNAWPRCLASNTSVTFHGLRAG